MAHSSNCESGTVLPHFKTAMASIRWGDLPIRLDIPEATELEVPDASAVAARQLVRCVHPPEKNT